MDSGFTQCVDRRRPATCAAIAARLFALRAAAGTGAGAGPCAGRAAASDAMIRYVLLSRPFTS